MVALRAHHLVLPLLLLAGCSEGAPPAAVAPMGSSQEVAPEDAADGTATWFLAAPPLLLPVLAGDEVRVGLASVAVDDWADLPAWRMERPDLEELVVEVVVWVESFGDVTNLSPTGCFWIVYVHDELGDRDDYRGAFSCFDEPVQVPSGVRELRTTLRIDGSDGFRGDALVLRVGYGHGVLGGDAAVSLLAGSPAHDSHIRLPDRQAP